MNSRFAILLGLALTCLIFSWATPGCRRSNSEVPPRSVVPGVISKPDETSPEREAPNILQWTDITREAGIDFRHRNGEELGHHSILESLGGGVALFDFDGDGRLDLFFGGGGTFVEEQVTGHPSVLYRQVGPLEFRDISSSAGEGFPSERYTHGCFAADFDNDGFTDLLVTGYGGVQLWRNMGDGTFEQQQEMAGLIDKGWSTGAAWGDFNEDGNLDLYIVHYVDWSFENHPRCVAADGETLEICSPLEFSPVRDTLWLSNGNGTFRNASLDGGLRTDGRGLGVAVSDFNGNGHLDIFVANDASENFLYLNDGFAAFSEESAERGVALSSRGVVARSSGVDVGDFNQDGYPDLWVTNGEGERFSLHSNEGDGTFLDLTHITGMRRLEEPLVGFGTKFVDVTRNGFLDLVFANGHVLRHPDRGTVRQRPLVLLNEQGRRFQVWEPDENSYFHGEHLGRGLAVGDLNNNGAIDLVFTHNNGAPALLRNDRADQGGWLGVRLIGRQSPRDGTGVRLELETERTSQWQWATGGTSYLSHGDSRIFWGFPASDRPMRLRVNWPSGQEQILVLPPAGQVLTLVEP